MAEQTTNDDPLSGPAQFTAKVESVLDPAYRLATVVMQDETAAEDAVVSASVRAWRRRRQVASAGFRPWFLSIVASEARRARWMNLLRAREADNEVSAYELETEDVRQVLSRLGGVERAALFCFFYLHLPMEEVAQVLRTSTRAARSRIYRAAQRPRKDRAQGPSAMDQRSLRDTFESMTRPPRAGLTARVREAVAEQAEKGRAPLAALPTLPSLPRPRVPRLVLPTTALVALAVFVGVLFIASGVVFMGRQMVAVLSSGRPGGGTAPASSPAPAGSPSAPVPSPSVSPTPIVPAATPTPEAAPTPAAPPPLQAAPGFACSTQTGGGAGSASVTAARIGSHPGYDRLVLEFAGPVPQFEVKPQDSPVFGQVTLAGAAGALVTVRNASSSGGYFTVLRQSAPVLLEARQLGAAGGTVQWGMGLSRPTCFRITMLSGPPRLVVDVQA